ncbi:unnamed protein product [Adineta steineri]|uniref:Uncharacterized protein n=1 Tax=Adineta steineri TaxID=433720 RepID=A0A814ZP37_9BILA|nr:unnamed protein product [Adineta steineri]CAF3927763.1 unnamed protein product [Adineta steineri]
MSSTTIDYQKANPLLFTFRDYHTGIQPYWIIVAQFLVFDFSLRTWDRTVYGTWQLPIEYLIDDLDGGEQPYIDIDIDIDLPEPISYPRYNPPPSPPRSTSFFFFQPWFLKRSSTPKKKTKVRPPKLDLFDLIFVVIPLLGHTIWFCVIQSSCLSANSATIWNCYNIFGYRLYNYIIDRYISFSKNFISKLIIMRKYKKLHSRMESVKERTWRTILSRIIQSITLSISSLTFVFSGALLLPYLFTNAIPMMFAYIFLVVIYSYLVTAGVVLFEGISYGIRSICNRRKSRSSKSLTDTIYKKRKIALTFGATLLPTLMSILFNLSQYMYYGADYWQALTNDAISRDPVDYDNKIGHSPTQIGHTILASI